MQAAITAYITYYAVIMHYMDECYNGAYSTNANCLYTNNYEHHA